MKPTEMKYIVGFSPIKITAPKIISPIVIGTIAKQNPPNHQPLLFISCNSLKLTAAKSDTSASDPIIDNSTVYCLHNFLNPNIAIV